MHLSNRSTSVLLSFVLATTMVPAVPAFAADSAEQPEASAVSVPVVSEPVTTTAVEPALVTDEPAPAAAEPVTTTAPQQEFTGFVYDKADFYVVADEPRMFADSGEEATASLSPLYLSDEMKYFAKYESGQDYDHGLSYGDGYNAMGYYQFDRRYGLRDFMLACYDYDADTYGMFAQFESYTSSDFRDLDVREYDDGEEAWVFSDFGNALNDAWHAAYAANPSEFAGLQDAWAYDSYYLPAERYLKNRGIDISHRADCVKGLCWGMSNLFGTGGWRKFVGGVTSGYDWNGEWQDSYDWPGAGLTNDMSDVEFVTTLCNYVVDNVAIFYKAQPEYHAGWQNRYRSELQDCLEYLQCVWVDVDGEWQYHVKGVPVKGQWYKTNQYWSYFDADGNALRNGWHEVNGAFYFFDEGCYLLTSAWIEADKAGEWYYVGPDGARCINKWVKTGEYWSYFGPDGYAYKDGKKLIDGKYYFFDANCCMYADRWYEGSAQDEWYYVGVDGACAIGKTEIGDRTFYFDAKGRMYHGFTTIDGDAYYFNEKHDGYFGAMETGWITFDKGRRYFDTKRGDSYGVMARGWLVLDDAWMYCDPSTGYQQIDWQTIDDQLYYLNPEKGEGYGSLVVGWVRLGIDEWVYLNEYHDGTYGAALTGWQWVDTNWFHFNETKGERYAHADYGWKLIDRTWYYFEEEHNGHFGEAAEGWKTIDGEKYYFFSNRSMASNQWFEVDDTWYYAASRGYMESGWLLDGSTWYFLDKTGAMMTDWQFIDDEWYYFKWWGGMAQSQWYGDYYLTSSGAMATNQWIGNYYVGADGRWVH